MAPNRNNSDIEILRDPVLTVKAKLRQLEITNRQVAHAARLPESTLSEVLSGKNRNVNRQIDVLFAVCSLTGAVLSVRQLFGPLAAREAA